VGYDATPDPGLRGPTNFAGLVGRAALADFDAGLARALAEHRCGRARPDASPRHLSAAGSALLPRTAGLCRCVKSMRGGACAGRRAQLGCVLLLAGSGPGSSSLCAGRSAVGSNAALLSGTRDAAPAPGTQESRDAAA